MCVQAAINLSDNYNKDLSDVDFIIVATTTPDQIVPNVASQVQTRLKIPHAGAIDISCACAGFCNGLILAKGLVAAGTHKKILVFGADTLSKVTDFTDRTTCILFGDAAGAVIVERSEENCLLETITETNGEFGKDLYLTSQKNSINDEEVIANNKLHQNGRIVYSVRKYGNTSAASIPLAWYEGIRSNKIQLNDKLLLMGFGGGFTYGGICIKNQIPNL